MINKNAVFNFFLMLLIVYSTPVICTESTDELAISLNSLKRSISYDTVKLASLKNRRNEGDLQDELEELKVDSKNLENFDVPYNKEIIIISNLSNFRKNSLKFLCDVLSKIAKENDIREIRLLNGSSAKFNIIFPTIINVFEEYCSNKKQLIIYYSADKNRTQTQKAARKGMNSLVCATRGLNIFSEDPEERDVIAVKSPWLHFTNKKLLKIIVTPQVPALLHGS